MFLVNNITREIDFKSLREAFRALDKKNTGLLSLTEIKNAFREVRVPEEDLEEIFQRLDHDHDGQINYSEFLAATVDRKKALSMQNLWFAFHHYDVDNSGYITEASLTEVFHREGKYLSQE